MGDDVRLHEELRRIKQLISSDVSMQARFDPDGTGEMDAHEWEQVENLVAGRLERQVAGAVDGSPTDVGVVTMAEVAPGDIAREVFQQDLVRDPGRDLAPRIDVCDELVLENQSGSARDRHRYSILTPDERQLGTIERIESDFASKTGLRNRFSSPESWFTIRPLNGDIVRFRHTEGFIAEAIEVQSIFGRTMARVAWQPFRWGYHYRVLSESHRVLNVDGRNAGDYEMDVSEGGATIGTIEYNRRVRHKGALESETREVDRPRRAEPPDRSDEPELESVHQRVIRVAAGHLTASLRWGLLATAMFADQPPRLFSGWIRQVLGERR